ncbi:MAG TPA: DNA repair protein RecO [Candidatus Binatia bacterium]|nr:DNA repair protein RecO [Candidatus Binatia bacterium]
MPTEIITPAFVLRTRSYGESDRIVTLITEQYGKVTGIAKGAKNSRRRFAGTLEPFVHIRAVFQQRPASDLVFMLRCDLLEAMRTFTSDLDRFTAGSYVLDLTDRMVFGRESGSEVYRLVHDALTLLARGARVSPVLRAFELHLLAMSGYAPALDSCRECGVAAVAGTMVYLVVNRGGLLCRRCVPSGEPIRPVAGATALELARLASVPLAEVGAGAGGDCLDEATIIAEQLLGGVTSGPVRSRAFLDLARVDSPEALR